MLKELEKVMDWESVGYFTYFAEALDMKEEE